MRCGGVSLLGNYHAKNQDRFCSTLLPGAVSLLAVSDGLGSCSWSEIGASALIQAAVKVLSGRKNITNLLEWQHCLQDIHHHWLSILEKAKYKVVDCCCTALLCVVMPGKLYCARLGDGMIGLVVDQKVHTMYDAKDDCFANETYCLHQEYQPDEWDVQEIPFTQFSGALACTDGISIAAGKYESFTKDFMREYESKQVEQIQLEMKDWVSHWRSNDDKTIGFILPDIQEKNGVGADE